MRSITVLGFPADVVIRVSSKFEYVAISKNSESAYFTESCKCMTVWMLLYLAIFLITHY